MFPKHLFKPLLCASTAREVDVLEELNDTVPTLKAHVYPPLLPPLLLEP